MAINIEAKLKPGESADRLIRRFFKKCKKHEIVREYLDKVCYFRSKREKRRLKSAKNKFRKNEDKD